jgi:hypothetical protein
VDELMTLVREGVDRSRRIETRLTKYLASIGFETGSRKPVWVSDGVVEAPSPACSIVDCLAVVPEDWDRDDEIAVMFRGQLLGCVLKP